MKPASSLRVFLALLPSLAWPEFTPVKWETGTRPALILEWTAEGLPAEATVTVAVPPGCSGISSTLEILEEKPLAANAAPTEAGGQPIFGTPTRFRDASIATLQWRPIRRQGDRVFFITRARLKLHFKPGSSAPRRAFAGKVSEPSERLLKSWLINYEQSRQFRFAPGGLARTTAAVVTLPAVRLVVFTQRDAIEVLTYDALRRAGVPVAKIDPRGLRLFRGGRELPLFVQGQEDGRFDANDFVEFIGARASGPGTFLSPYTNDAAFYLAWDMGPPGLRAPAVPVAPRAPGLSATPPYRAMAHVEEDNAILRIGSTAAQDITDLGGQVTEDELSDFWFWRRMGPEKDLVDVPFDLPYSPAGGQGVLNTVERPVLRIQLKGITNDIKADPDHHLRFLLNGVDISLIEGVRNDALWEGQNSYTWVSSPLPPGALKAGTNVLSLVRVNDLRTSDGNLVQNQDAYLNFVEADLRAQTTAVRDALHFTNAFADSLGRKHFRLDGFTAANPSLWDKRGRKLVGFDVRKQGAGYQVDFEDSLLTQVDYLAAAGGGLETPRLRLDTLPDLSAPKDGADLIIVTHRDLYGTALDSLAARRTQQGLRVKVVDVQHLYQQFGDGSVDPAAMRRFAQWAYEQWPRPAPTYLLLLGETSDWFDKLDGALQRNLVPTHLVNIRGWGVAAADDYFGRVAGDDALSDLLVGRIPVASKTDLSRVVEKILRLEQRPPGAWNNKTYFVGGYEASFTAGQNRLQSLAAGGDRPPARLDLFPSSGYFRTPSQRANFYRQLDSAFNFLGFFGHGGGAVWSDAGILTMDALDHDSLRGEYPIPLVSSITCLTGYFEDVSERSLGEEMLRRPKNGAAGFYGAAGYISNAVGQVLAAEVFQAAARPGPLTLGGVVQQAETQVQLKTGARFLPVLAEFNLLGDPSMPYGYAPRSGTLDATPKALGAARTLDVSGQSLAVTSGSGLATLLIGDSTASATTFTVAGGRFTQSFRLPDSLPVFQSGKVVAHVWDANRSAVYATAFSGLDWMIDSLRLEPPNPQPGDSARVRFILRNNVSVAGGAGAMAYSVTGDEPGSFPPDNLVGVVATGGNGYTTAGAFPIPFPGGADDPLTLQLNVLIRLNLTDSAGGPLLTVSSRVYSFALKPLAHLGLMRPAFRLPVEDSLGVWVRYRNDGLGQNGKARVVLASDPNALFPWKDSAAANRVLALGQTDSVFIALPDSATRLPLHANLIPDNPAELNARSNAQDTSFRLWTALLRTMGDSLQPGSGGPTVRLAAGAAPRRVFAGDTVALLGAALAPVDSSALARRGYFFATRDGGNGSLRLEAPADLAAGPGSATAAWHFADKASGPWLRLDTASVSGPSAFFRTGYYGYFRNADRTPPVVTFHSRGQALLQDDYIPRNTPVEVLLEDPSGIDLDLRKPKLLSGAATVDTASLVVESTAGFPTLARVQFKPRQTARDSITVLAYDAAGNLARKGFSFRVGEKLAVRNLGAYPNPFADTTIFAYELTDYCDEVVLRVFSRSGRTVRTLRDAHAVGYREVTWDGRSDGGHAIANGLYFLKATARIGGREAEATFKLFKKKY